jgi:electron transport complex protein RnfC
MSLMPVSLALASETKDIEKLKKYDVMSCIECGSCSFVCPAHRHVLQSIRVGKQLFKESGKAAK